MTNALVASVLPPSPDPVQQDSLANIPASTGWPPDARERGDFFHRVRAFPAEVAAWREWMIDHVGQHRDMFRSVPRGSTRQEIRARIDDGVTYLREVARVLAVLHGTPSLGNKTDPVDELVYIILARKTREEAYQATFDALRKQFPRWDALLEAPRGLVTRLVHSGGLSAKKTVSLFGALEKLRATFGSCTLDPARDWPDAQLEAFLCSLPEISRKSAYCIMMYALGRKVFPVDTHVGRVLGRLAPYKELGLHLGGLDHKKLQVVLGPLVPPNLRYSLHVNLVAHGRTVCRSLRPLCRQCDLRNLCATYRRKASKAATGPTVVDLFAGAGGLSEGFERAGFRSVLALDSDPVSLRTYWINHPHIPDNRVVLRDIRDLHRGELRRMMRSRAIDVLVAAPPCQGFSHAGYRSKKTRTGYRVTSDQRNFLFEHMVAAVLELRPRLVLMENVPGMQSAKRENVSFLEIAARLLERKARYRTAIWRLNASAYGIPQDRVRYFLIASRTGSIPQMPPPEYQDLRGDFDHDALPPVTLEEAIFDLPARDAGSGTAVERWAQGGLSQDSRYRRYVSKFGLLRPSCVLYNHHVRYQNERDLELYALLQPGEDSVHAIERHGRHDLMRYRRDVFDDKYCKLRGDRPSKTIVAHLAKDGNAYIHPTQVRSLSVRECARLQSFHDGYAFCGSPSDQWVQIGNAVPPVLAEVVARSFLKVIKGTSR